MGERFPKLIKEAIDSAKVVLVVIGPDWLDTLNGRATQPGIDYVRAEVGRALARNAGCDSLRIIPVLMGGTSMPSEEDIAEPLRAEMSGLLGHNAHAFIGSQADLDKQFERLRVHIASVEGVPTPRFRPPSGATKLPVEIFQQIQVYTGLASGRLNYHQEIGGVLDYFNRRCVGREREFETVAAFLSGSGEGAHDPYLLVEAPGGFGKSTFLAHILNRAESGAWPAYKPSLIYFFIRGRSNTALAFLRAVNSQLLEYLDVPGGTPATFTELRGQFSQLWAAAEGVASAEAPLGLFVDALDQQQPASNEQPVAIADLLPIPLSDYVRVVVSSRPKPSAREQVAREHPLRRAPSLSLSTFDMHGVRSVLTSLIETKALEQTPVSSDLLLDALAGRIRKLTGGEPLFVRFVAEEVAQGGEEAMTRLESNPPQDAEDYFRDQLSALLRDAEGKLVWSILGFLIEARAGLTAEELAELTGQQLRKIRDALVPIARYLMGDERVELMHMRLSDRIAGEFGQQEIARTRARLLGWCQAYAGSGWPESTPDYVLQQYAFHLKEEGEYEKLFGVCDGALMKLHHSRHQLEWFVQDLELVVAAAMNANPVAWVPLIKTCYTVATIRELSSAVSPTSVDIVARYENIESAIDNAKLRPSGEQRVEAVARIAQILAERNKVEEARELLSQALDELDVVQVGNSHSCHQSLCRALKAAQDTKGLERLAEIAENIAHPESQAALLGPVIEAIAHVVSKERALILMRRHLPNDLAFLNLAITLQPEFDDAALLDDVEALVPSSTTLEKSPFRVAVVLANLATARAKSGDAPKAAATAAKALQAAEAGVVAIKKSHEVVPFALGSGWAKLASLLSHAFVADAARRAEAHAWSSLEQCDNELELGMVASALAGLLIEREPASINLLFNRLHRHPLKLGAVGNSVLAQEIAVGFARLGDAKGAELAARLLTDELSDHSVEAELWPEIARGLAEAKRYAEAREAIRRSSDFGGEIDALTAVADVLSTHGMGDEALELALRATELAERKMASDRPSHVLASFAEALANAGSAERAKELAAEVFVAYEALSEGKRTGRDFASVMDALRVTEMRHVALDKAIRFWDHRTACHSLSVLARDAGDELTAEVAAHECVARAMSPEVTGRERLSCLISAALALEPRDPNKARGFLAEVIKLISIEGCEDRANLATAQATLGDLDDAKATLQWFFEEAPFARVVARPCNGCPAQTVGAKLEDVPKSQKRISKVYASGWLSAALAFHAVQLDGEADALGRQTLIAVAERPIVFPRMKLATVVEILARRDQTETVRCLREKLVANRSSPARMIAEAAIVCGLEQAGLVDVAKELLADTVARTRFGGRQDFFEAIAGIADVVARWDCGKTLWLIHEALGEVNAWWGSPNVPTRLEVTATSEQMAARDGQLKNDHLALMLTRKQLSGEVRVGLPTELIKALRTTSAPVKEQIFSEANGTRSRNWREKKDVMERTILIFKALIESDPHSAPHYYFGALGWALHDQEEPDYLAATASLDRAIDLLPEGVDQPYYQLVRALCNIRLDENFQRGEASAPIMRKKILADLQYAEGFLRSTVGGDSLISKWRRLNS